MKQETKQALLNDLNKFLIGFSVLIVCSLVAGFVFLEYSRTYYTNNSAPGQYLNGYNFSGLNQLEAQSYLTGLIQKIKTEPITFEFKDQKYQITHQDLGITLDYNKNIELLKFYDGKPSRLELLKDQFSFRKEYLVKEVDPLSVEKVLTTTIPNVAPASSAKFAWDGLALTVTPELIGNSTDFGKITSDIVIGKTDVLIDSKPELPTVYEQDLIPLTQAFQSFISEPIQLFTKNQTFNLAFNENPQIVEFKKDQNKLSASIEPLALRDFLLNNVSSKVESKPGSFKISLVNDKVQFEGEYKTGNTIDYTELEAQINTLITQRLFENSKEVASRIELPIKQVEPELLIDQALQQKGIKELVSTGYTTYFGSPANRLHNIRVGTATYNGMIIPKGETFSFNNNLGPVTKEAGYLPELVIKGKETIPEFGGGLCQVSTTIYRGVLQGGFEVPERYNHSYAVGYYAQVLGHGLDATIYPGHKDFRFTNDTPGDLLMYAYTEGPTMTVKFFGTNDERKVELIGPTILSESGTGAPEYIEKPDMAPGSSVMAAAGHNGLVTRWVQKITHPNGKITENVINSNYRSVAPKYYRGPAPAPVYSGPTI